MGEPANAAPAGTRFTMHVVVTVTDPADGLGLEPISPPRMSRVFGAVLRKLVADDPHGSQADVGAVSVTLQQAPDLDYLDRQAMADEEPERLAPPTLPMIPLPSGGIGRGGGPDQ
jgi:hypothetical protein